jgi:acetolactate synthase I/II/III large subunit
MNGAQALLRTLVGAGVDVCFANPGTSEMHFVAALDDVPAMRGVLTLFEGVATGAADGYARMTKHPAATLLHLGPGLANGLANLHNARRAGSPIVNVVGDHATSHKRFDSLLESDIESLARPVSQWFRVSLGPADAPADAADAIAGALGPPSGVATLVLPADVSWSEGADGPAPPPPRRRASSAAPASVEEIAKALRDGGRAGLLLGGNALDEASLRAAGRVVAATGARLFGETFPARLRRGAGLPAVERLGYFAELVEPQLGELEQLVLVGARAPVSFFAYPGRPSDLVPAGCHLHRLADRSQDAPAALEALADALGAGGAEGQPSGRPERPTGALTAESMAAGVGALLPEEAIVVDEANTSGVFLPRATAGAPPHDWLALTGGAIGQGLPVATGAAVAAPDRKVLCLESDGSAMYTIQALWTQAREGLDVTTVILSNRSYGILNVELTRVGASGGRPRAAAMLDLGRPVIDFVTLAESLGVPAVRATTADELVASLERGLAETGPSLVEAVLPDFTRSTRRR